MQYQVQMDHGTTGETVRRTSVVAILYDVFTTLRGGGTVKIEPVPDAVEPFSS